MGLSDFFSIAVVGHISFVRSLEFYEPSPLWMNTNVWAVVMEIPQMDMEILNTMMLRSVTLQASTVTDHTDPHVLRQLLHQ